MKEFSPWPCFTEEEAEAVKSVLLSNRVNQWTGDSVQAFEKAFADHFQVPYAVAVSNGTAALEIALAAAGVGPGDEVIVPPRTFVATASSVVLRGATPVFADVDLDSQLITAASVEPLITARTRAIICVHLAGWPCDMDGFRSLIDDKNIILIEDCAQSHGAMYKGRSTGSLGDVAAWSFCQDKIMTTGGEGGMVTTGDESIFRKAWSYKDHGKSFAAVFEKEHPPGFRWLHESFGTNARMTSMQAAIGTLQIEKLPAWTERRSLNAEKIIAAARDLPGLRVPEIPREIVHAWYKCYLFVDPEQLSSGWSRDRIIDEICARGVPCFSGSCSEVYLEEAFKSAGLEPAPRLPNARRLGDTSLMFLVHPTLTSDEIGRTCSVLSDVMRAACTV